MTIAAASSKPPWPRRRASRASAGDSYQLHARARPDDPGSVPPEDIHEGDIFISNDPYAARGSRLPDVDFATPIFIDGKLVVFSSNIAHHADIGGVVTLSMSSNMVRCSRRDSASGS